jgi:hypothetical protein
VGENLKPGNINKFGSIVFKQTYCISPDLDDHKYIVMQPSKLYIDSKEGSQPLTKVHIIICLCVSSRAPGAQSWVCIEIFT